MQQTYTPGTAEQLVLPIAASILLVALLFTLQMTYGFFVESRAKRKLTHLFGQYVPPSLVSAMSKQTGKINLDGEIRHMSVLFTDIRGFTNISENFEAKELTHYINAFLTPITQIIHNNRGTIDKYMGDAVMAFWGAPLEDQQHARHALDAALSIVEQMKVLRKEFTKKQWPEIYIGIGVNTGKMNVGNKGSEFRVDYTVLGDAVNLGARLEGLAKIYDVDIITSEYTKHAVPEYEYREIDRVRVKGKNQSITIYQPLGLSETIDESEKKIASTISPEYRVLIVNRTGIPLNASYSPLSKMSLREESTKFISIASHSSVQIHQKKTGMVAIHTQQNKSPTSSY